MSICTLTGERTSSVVAKGVDITWPSLTFVNIYKEICIIVDERLL